MATMEGFASMDARRALPRDARAFDVAEKRSYSVTEGWTGRASQPPSATRRNSAREDVVTSLLKG